MFGWVFKFNLVSLSLFHLRVLVLLEYMILTAYDFLLAVRTGLGSWLSAPLPIVLFHGFGTYIDSGSVLRFLVICLESALLCLYLVDWVDCTSC